jgi:hypothetical protein
VRLLIVVNRAQLGFDFSELFNFVDMTGSRNPDRIFQMFCRVVRSSKDEPSHNKLFVKVLSRAFSEIQVRAFMSGVLSLSTQENFEKWNGKGFSLLDIPVEKDDRKRSGKHKDPEEEDGAERQMVPTLEPGMLVWGDYFRALEHNPDDPLAVYAYARLGDVVGERVRDPDGRKRAILDWLKHNNSGSPSKAAKDFHERSIAASLSQFVNPNHSAHDADLVAQMIALGWTSKEMRVTENEGQIWAFMDSRGTHPKSMSKDPEEARLGRLFHNYILHRPDFRAEAARRGFIKQADHRQSMNDELLTFCQKAGHRPSKTSGDKRERQLAAWDSNHPIKGFPNKQRYLARQRELEVLEIRRSSGKWPPRGTSLGAFLHNAQDPSFLAECAVLDPDRFGKDHK